MGKKNTWIPKKDRVTAVSSHRFTRLSHPLKLAGVLGHETKFRPYSDNSNTINLSLRIKMSTNVDVNQSSWQSVIGMRHGLVFYEKSWRWFDSACSLYNELPHDHTWDYSVFYCMDSESPGQPKGIVSSDNARTCTFHWTLQVQIHHSNLTYRGL